MAGDLRDRLRRLGVKQGREGVPAPMPKSPAAATPGHSAPLGGREVVTDLGACYIIETAYPISYQHGARTLDDLLHCQPHTAAHISQNAVLANAPLSELAFFDIETTGLAGGAGTLAFLIGVGAFEEDSFVLRQFFLRDPSEEPALLSALTDTFARQSGLVTFNGRSFDVPIVETRFALARRPFDLRAMPHLDLLMPARRLYRGRFENCSLGTLEVEVLGLQRTEEDVPGYLIPQLYVDYLRTGDTTDMRRVIYHNAEDILSMVTLAAHILETFEDPTGDSRTGLDCLRLALWHDDHQHPLEADEAYRAAMARGLPQDHLGVLFNRYGVFLKRAGRRAEAVTLWQQWADLAPADPAPCIELAKFYEWEAQEIALAQKWSTRALLSLSHWRKGWQYDEAWREIEHRLLRLKRKQTKTQ